MSPIMRKQVDKVNQNPASHDEPADQVFEAIHAIMHLYRSRQYRALRAGGHALSHMDTKVLAYFARHPGATQSELVAYSGRDKAQLARLVRGLRDQGLLEARADEEDRRSTRLQLTASGQALFRSLHEQGARLSGLAVANLDRQERRLLLGLLQRVQSALESEPESGTSPGP